VDLLDVGFRPSLHGGQQEGQAGVEVGEFVVDAEGDGRGDRSREDAVAFQGAPGLRQHLGADAGELAAEVADAVGMAADAPRVFDRFDRADAARSLPGSGLGLAIVRDVAESHTAAPSSHAPGSAAAPKSGSAWPTHGWCDEAGSRRRKSRHADLVRAAAGVHQRLDRRVGLRVTSTQDAEVVAELPHHLRRQVAAGLGVLRVVRDVLGPERELLGQAVQKLAGLGQPEAAHPVEEGHDVIAAEEPQLSALVRPVQPRTISVPSSSSGRRWE
jgi:hypothetical protein